MSKILVTGATGNVGARLVRLLVSRSQAVRAFTRKGEQAQFDPKVETVTGDFTNKKSLLNAMKGVSRMYMLSAGHELELGWAATIKAQDTVYGALGDAAVPIIDPEDIAEVAATVLSTPGQAGKAYELSGAEPLTMAQQVATLGSVLGRPLKSVNVPDSAAREAMAKMGMPAPYVDAMVGLIQTLRSIGRIPPTGDVKALLGREPRSFRQWAEANAAAFR